MNKIKITLICFFIPCVILIVFAAFKIKQKVVFGQKVVLALETRKVLEHLMVDLRGARQNTILDVPPDGQWHHRIAFDRAGQGALEYTIDQGHLYRVNKGDRLLIADDIVDLRIRRQKDAVDIFEVQIEAHKDASLISNFKIRVH